MDKIYYARKEEFATDIARIGLYENPPPEESETRYINWPIDYKKWVENTGIEIELGELKKLKIQIELIK